MVLRLLLAAPALLFVLMAPGPAPAPATKPKVPPMLPKDDGLVLVPDAALGAAKEQARKRVLAGKFDTVVRPRAHDLARGHLKQLLADKGNPADDLEVLRSFPDGDRVLVHMRHTHGGIPVLGSEAIVEMESDGAVVQIVDDVRPEVNRAKKSLVPGVTADAAIQAALAVTGLPKDKLAGKPETRLWFVRDAGGDDVLAWRVALRRQDRDAVSFPVVFLDAATGKRTLLRYDNLQTGTVQITGTSTYSGNVALTGYQSGSSYYLEDTGRKLGTFTYNNTTTSVSRASDTDAVFNAAAQKAAVDAHYAMQAVHDYFKTVHGRTGIDGNGGPGYVTASDGATPLTAALVHYSTRYNNAFWDGQKMTFGDGDGTTFGPLTTLDITGHEMTHGVIERTAGLLYSGESGALNESFADVFGAMVERHVRGESANTWKIGEEAYTPANGTGDALRYLDNPHLASDSGFTSDDDPDHYSERYTGTSDNGGVHINSGIGNKAFYLLARGGSHHKGGSMTGIGADKAAKIWYRALTTYMTSSTTFAGARTATIDAATALHGVGSPEALAVASAWALVGVGTGGTTPPQPTTSELVANGGLESALVPWATSGAGALYTNNGNYPQAGTGYAYFGAANSVTGQTSQQITIPAGTSPTLSFYLNVTTAESTTTTQYDKLFVEVRNSAGTLLSTPATYSNLNKVATAGQYAQKSLSLAAYAGQTVRIQFRASNDSSAITTFRVDGVSVK